MSVEHSNKIDAIGIDKQSKAVVLSISDHLNWDKPDEHLLILQDKVNNYLAFCESGELYDAYPSSVDKKIIIKVFGKFPLPKKGFVFFEKAKDIIKESGIDLEFHLLS